MTAYTAQTPPHAGLTLTLAAPGGLTGDTAPTGNNVALLVVNGAASSITVTLPISATYDNLGITSRTVTVPANSSALIPLPSSVYGPGPQAVNYSSITTVTVAVVVVPAG